MPTFSFSFGEAAAALATVLGVPSSKFDALKARMQHYQKKGFPAGTNTGRGKSAAYRSEHLAQLVVAFELNQFGLSPEQARDLLVHRADVLRASFREALEEALVDNPEAARDVLLHFDPLALGELVEGKRYSEETFGHLKRAELSQAILTWSDSGYPRIALIALTAILFNTARAIEASAGLDVDSFFQALRTWCGLDASDPQA